MEEKEEVLVKVDGLSKKFCKSLKKSLKYGMYDLVANLRGKDTSDDLRPDEFWALKDINFELRRGECLGLIGHNGAGKSTLLKILNGLINPDHGKVTMRGRVGALIELGAGFNGVMTGRENIYNNGAVLGFTREEIDAKVEEIIAFSELEEFMDMPVRKYSSGMKVRLGFAVAAQMEPDVLIIDEVLAVGDLGFVLKCFKQIDTILPNTAIIFVSHSMPMVSRICNQIILLDQGMSKFQGTNVSQAIDLYYTRFSNNESNVVFDDGSITLAHVQLLEITSQIENIPQLNWKDDFKLKLSFHAHKEDLNLEFIIIIIDKEQRPVASFQRNEIVDNLIVSGGMIDFTLTHHKLQLSKGVYSLNVAARNRNTKEPIYRSNSVFDFQVIHSEEMWEPLLFEATYQSQNNSDHD
jgi:lipopolysaccharide transport system ATP-binding protein